MSEIIKLALPTGRIQPNFFNLLSDAGIKITNSARSYRPAISLEGFEAKILKNQNIVEMLAMGRRDIGAAGIDWVKELNADLVELLDTSLDPVRIVAAAPDGFTSKPDNGRPFVVATEYTSMAQAWIEKNNFNATVVRSYGATEAFPPEDADCIIDNTSSGATLKASNLNIIDVLLDSSTRIFASPIALDNPQKRNRIEDFVLVLRSVLEARQRVMVEINVSKEDLDKVASVLPCMRTPTISELFQGAGYVVKAAVPKKILPVLIPEIKACGGCDIVVTSLSNVIP
jgi:ATP phosphoribosyltransferase